MSRKRKPEGYIQQKISLHPVLMARFTRIHWDPIHRKVKYGAVSQVLNRLLTDYVNRVEADPAAAQSILSDAEQAQSPPTTESL